WPGAGIARRGTRAWRVQVLVVGVGVGLGMTLLGAARLLEHVAGVAREPTPAVGIALALVGLLVWGYHALLARDDDAARHGLPYLVAGMALVFACVGVVVAVDEPWRGLAMLLPGMALWWPGWRAARPGRGRRTYLAVMLGSATLAAAGALIWLARMLLLHLVGEGARAGSGLGEAVATLGVAALVAGSHAWWWRRDKASAPPAPEAVGPRSAVLIGAFPDDAGPLLAEATGARVETLTVLDEDPITADIGALAEQLRAYPGDDVVVMAEPSGTRIMRIGR
ncbi:MAG: hypothetical protein GX596_11580, partial [Propionibacterium sp.]|nr:hypothetical protein [Propionibacterium sp.]